MRFLIVSILTLILSVGVFAQRHRRMVNYAENAIYAEAFGKGYYSCNIDFRINKNQRYSLGLTALHYKIKKDGVLPDEDPPKLTPGVMYYYLIGQNNNYFELGGGFSLYYRLWADYVMDSPLSLHWVVGYRYQKKRDMIFRVGLTPYYKVMHYFVPLAGVSVGYSW